ncbi:hypothetical protein SK128_003625, partial [Halocaridina rubra]
MHLDVMQCQKQHWRLVASEGVQVGEKVKNSKARRRCIAPPPQPLTPTHDPSPHHDANYDAPPYL